jgi:hypothetical protein
VDGTVGGDAFVGSLGYFLANVVHHRGIGGERLLEVGNCRVVELVGTGDEGQRNGQRAVDVGDGLVQRCEVVLPLLAPDGIVRGRSQEQVGSPTPGVGQSVQYPDLAGARDR